MLHTQLVVVYRNGSRTASVSCDWPMNVGLGVTLLLQYLKFHFMLKYIIICFVYLLFFIISAHCVGHDLISGYIYLIFPLFFFFIYLTILNTAKEFTRLYAKWQKTDVTPWSRRPETKVILLLGTVCLLYSTETSCLSSLCYISVACEDVHYSSLIIWHHKATRFARDAGNFKVCPKW